MMFTRTEVKQVVVNAFEILIACEKTWAEEKLSSEEMIALIRIRLREWLEDPTK